MNESRFAILGGGMVAGYAAKQLVELGLKPGELAILSADTSLPYERPPLSKGFLAGKEKEDGIRIGAEDFYREHGIEVKLACEITSVDAQRKRLVSKTGEGFAYGKLIVATGARPRILEVPGAELAQVHYLRSLEDSKAIRSAAEKVKRAAVIGGGFIAMEVSAVLAQKGIEVSMILNEERIWKKLFSQQMSSFFESYYAARGVRMLKSATVLELRREGGTSSVLLAGGATIACDMIVAGIGVLPATNMLANSGIEVSDGVVVNEYLESSQPHIYAAGDVANYADVLFGKRRRVEHWDNAVSQGQYCARAVLGAHEPFKHVPYFFSDIFDLSYEYWGDASVADQAVHRGDVSSASFSVWWMREGRVVAAFVMNRPEEERDAAPKWIENQQRVSASALQHASQPMAAAEQT